jgi:hypothetical protein
LFLTSDDAAFITAQAIVVDGVQYRIGYAMQYYLGWQALDDEVKPAPKPVPRLGEEQRIGPISTL